LIREVETLSREHLEALEGFNVGTGDLPAIGREYKEEQDALMAGDGPTPFTDPKDEERFEIIDSFMMDELVDGTARQRRAASLLIENLSKRNAMHGNVGPEMARLLMNISGPMNMDAAVQASTLIAASDARKRSAKMGAYMKNYQEFNTSLTELRGQALMLAKEGVPFSSMKNVYENLSKAYRESGQMYVKAGLAADIASFAPAADMAVRAMSNKSGALRLLGNIGKLLDDSIGAITRQNGSYKLGISKLMTNPEINGIMKKPLGSPRGGSIPTIDRVVELSTAGLPEHGSAIINRVLQSKDPQKEIETLVKSGSYAPDEVQGYVQALTTAIQQSYAAKIQSAKDPAQKNELLGEMRDMLSPLLIFLSAPGPQTSGHASAKMTAGLFASAANVTPGLVRLTADLNPATVDGAIHSGRLLKAYKRVLPEIATMVQTLTPQEQRLYAMQTAGTATAINRFRTLRLEFPEVYLNGRTYLGGANATA
jgi:hypothetical protein